jgi:hypothetical protein
MTVKEVIETLKRPGLEVYGYVAYSDDDGMLFKIAKNDALRIFQKMQPSDKTNAYTNDRGNALFLG